MGEVWLGVTSLGIPAESGNWQVWIVLISSSGNF